MVISSTAKFTVHEHLLELRRRVIIYVLCLAAGGIFGYLIYPQLIELLAKPLNKPLFYSSPAGGVSFIFDVCLFTAFFLSLPVFVYQLLKFMQPIIFHSSQKKIYIYSFSSLFLAVLGMLFAYFISLPAMLHFFAAFDSSQIHSLIAAGDYLNFVIKYLSSFALLCQLPLLLLFINSFTRLRVKQLMKYERWVIVASFIFAAVFAPDVFNQLLMALPIIVLYNSSILLLWIVNRRKKD